MVRTKTYYQLYQRELEVKITELSNKIIDLEKEIIKLKNLLNPYRVFLNQNLNQDLETILKFTNRKEYTPFTNSENGILNSYIRAILLCNEKITINKELIEQYKAQKVDFKLYNLIIKKANTKFIDEVIDKDYKLNFGRLGIIMIVKRNNKGKRKRVNWGESNKKKKKILEEGNIPYYKADAEKAKEKGVKYRGIEWLVYLPDLDFMFIWIKLESSEKYNPFIKDFRFRPPKGTDGPIVKLSRVKKDIKVALNRYLTSFESIKTT